VILMATFRDASSAVRYEAPYHFGVQSRRLQGLEASETTNYWVAVSDFEPAGGASESPARGETTYVGIRGELTVGVDGVDYVLKPGDSMHLVPGELRTVINNGSEVATILVVIAP
jgi:quercetin dioxygenase-like cupin family protein